MAMESSTFAGREMFDLGVAQRVAGRTYRGPQTEDERVQDADAKLQAERLQEFLHGLEF
jgi:hypothetical protein